MGSISFYMFRTTLVAFVIVLTSLTVVVWFTQAMRDFDLITTRKRMFDATGHDNRPEVFRLEVNDRPKPSVITTSDTAEATGTHVTTEEPAQAWSKGSAHAPVDGDAAGAR